MSPRRRSKLLWSLLVPAFGCSFNAAGNGFPEGASVGEGSSSSGDAAPDEDEPAPDPEPPTTMTGGGGSGSPGGGPHASAGEDGSGSDTTPSDDPSTAGSDDGSAISEGDSNAGTTTGEPDACPAEVFELIWIDEGDLVSPMALIAADANDSPNVAYSQIAESGEVTVSLEFACAGEYTLWGLVWDYDPGAWGEPDPDSFYFDVGGAESTWRYGCQTADAASGLSWQRMAALSAQPCSASYVVLEVYEAGTVELTLRNREAGAGSQVAGVAAIVVSDDPDADPSALYDPY